MVHYEWKGTVRRSHLLLSTSTIEVILFRPWTDPLRGEGEGTAVTSLPTNGHKGGRREIQVRFVLFIIMRGKGRGAGVDGRYVPQKMGKKTINF